MSNCSVVWRGDLNCSVRGDNELLTRRILLLSVSRLIVNVPMRDDSADLGNLIVFHEFPELGLD